MSPAAVPPPSGTQYAIAYGDHRAVVTEVGATLRELALTGCAALDGFDVEQRAAEGRGQVLAPWPNRLAEGRYAFGGHSCQAPVNEVERNNAIHGLVRWLHWWPVTHEESAVTLAHTLRPQPGYEWQLDLAVTYRLDEDGLTVTARAENSGHREAPFGVGFHPYLTLAQPVDEVELGLPAKTHLSPADPDVVPEAVPVSGSDLDFSTPRRVGSTVLDTCFGDLSRGSDGRAIATLSDPASGRGLQLWVDESFPYLMVYTADGVGDPQRRRGAIAIEPMSCPPNAFRSGADLIRLAPRASWQASWGIRTSQLPHEGTES